MTVFVVEDETNIRELVVYTLRTGGFDADGFADGAALYARLEETVPGLLLLDLMLPGESGLEILARLRRNAATKHLPVILLTAKDSEYDKVLGLDSGADDYITKPFGTMELLSRVRAVLRRAPAGGSQSREELRAGGIVLHPASHSAQADGAALALTAKEFALLRLLLENPGTVLTRDVILEAVWGYSYEGETRTVDVHVRALRQKLGNESDRIETVRGVGYRLRAGDAPVSENDGIGR